MQAMALILSRIPKVSRQRGSGNTEQLRCPPLIATCLLINKMHVPSDRAGEREIDTVLTLVVIV